MRSPKHDFNYLISNRTLVRAKQCGLGGLPHEQLFQEDLEQKTITYARNGIDEYWVIDLQNNELIVHAQPRNDGYTQVQKYKTGTISSLAFPQIKIDCDRLLLY